MQVNYIEVLINVVLASFGGLVKKLTELEQKRGKSGKKVSFSYYAIGAIVSMFVGIVVYFLCKNFNLSPFLTAGLTAISGYIGAPMLDLLSDILKKNIKKQGKV